MQDGKRLSLEQIQAFLEASEELRFEASDRREFYEWVGRTWLYFRWPICIDCGKHGTIGNAAWCASRRAPRRLALASGGVRIHRADGDICVWTPSIKAMIWAGAKAFITSMLSMK
jgi:hypothetical protein